MPRQNSITTFPGLSFDNNPASYDMPHPRCIVLILACLMTAGCSGQALDLGIAIRDAQTKQPVNDAVVVAQYMYIGPKPQAKIDRTSKDGTVTMLVPKRNGLLQFTVYAPAFPVMDMMLDPSQISAAATGEWSRLTPTPNASDAMLEIKIQFRPSRPQPD